MYKKFLVIASKLDKAGINITTQLSQFRKNPILSGMQKEASSFDFYLVDNSILYNENLDMEKINKYDFVIFASKHRSSKGEKALTVHSIGNWREAEFGGEKGKLSKSSAVFQKQLFERLKENADEHDLKDYAVTMEATHHGPLIDKPSVFIEIGSTDIEYTDRRAGFVVAKTIFDLIENFKENPYNEIAVAVGGPHYCPNFNKIQLKSNVAISYVIPAYALPLTDEMVKEAIEKTEEEIDFFVLDWKGLGKAEQRDEVIKVLERNYIQWKKTGDIKR
jgi:D-aminoacyl-tRNA deacylase